MIVTNESETVAGALRPRQRAGSRKRTIALRVVFAAALVMLPAELVFQKYVAQPYPGVFQPSFAGTPLRGDILSAQIPIVYVDFTDGSRTEVGFEQVLPDSKLLDKSVFKSAFYNEARATADDTRDWLRKDLAELFPEQTATRMTVDWTDRKIDVTGEHEPVDTVTKTVVIDLTGSQQ
ncbi:hypothetical protein [Herbiconiux sp. YIM B11900]|uniref:hypothetical protein n=1 Tax=Herbiconiux sp. YIM B11900 TaxID=3404131 RepID=UPI003F842B75